LSSDKDDDLTDITQLPDFDEDEDDKSFASLDELAKESGPEEPDGLPDLPDLVDVNEEMTFDNNQEAEDSSFGEDESNFGEEETNFGEEESNFGEEETNFGEDESSSTEDKDVDSFKEDDDITSINKVEKIDDVSLSSSSKPQRNYESIENDLGQEATSKLTPLDELAPLSKVEESPSKKTPIESVTKTHTTPPEEFEEFKNFAKTMTFSNFSSEGNPPFSIILKNISFIEDVDDIAQILLELKVISDQDEETTREMLTRGQLLIPRLSEYAAIYLCHKLRRFDVEILMGLTEEISPPKSYSSNDRGPTSKRTIYANKKHHFKFNKTSQFDEILATTLPQLSDYQIIKYLGVITETRKLAASDISSGNFEDQLIEQVDENQKGDLHIAQIKRENLLASDSQNKFNYVDFQHLSES
jgi:hypothetical protein